MALEIYVPSSSNKAPIPELLPAYLTEADEQEPAGPTPIDWANLKRLDPPYVVTPGGYRLRQEIQDSLTNCITVYLHTTGKDRCHRCHNTGVIGWVAKGATAKVCKCVRSGAAAINASQEKA
jgi:hypothetical protein